MSEEEPKFVGTRRFGGQPVRQPAYNFRDVPYCSKDLAGSTLSEVTDRQHLVNSIAEFALLCNEATRRKHLSEIARGKKSRCPSKPLSIEYIFDRIDTDDPIWGFMVRTDTPMSSKGRTSNLKASPQWKRGMLQGFITVTTFTQWRSSFRFDSLHESAFAYDPDDLTELALKGIRKYDNDGRLAEELEATVHGGDPWNEGIVYPRIAEISLFGALGCGKKLLQLVIERLERSRASESQNYDYIVLQATENSIPFYESMGFVRVGCIMENKTSEKGYKSSSVESYVTKKHGETLAKISQEFGGNVWDTVFLNKPMYPTIGPRSWLKKGTTVFYHSTKAQILATSDASKTGQLGVTLEESSLAPKWYVAKENDTPRSIAKKFCVHFGDLLECNKKRYPELVGTSRLKSGTRIQVSRFDVEDEAYIPYSHWTFPDDELEPDEPSYMMAMKLERKTGKDAISLPIAESLSVPISPYSPDENGASEILQQPPAIKRTAPIFNSKKTKSVKKPKRPMNAFHFFSADFRSNKKELLQGVRLGECTKILTQEWKKLSDREKAPYLEKSKEMRIVYAKEMEEYKKEVSKLTPVGIDTSLLEQVVKLKSNVGAQSFTSKFQYWYVLTFIPDLQWVHLIPLKKVGVFGPEYPEAHGRTIWMIEDEGNELDTTAAMCTVVKSQTIANSEDADDEQWVIFDGEKPKLAPIFAVPKALQALKEPIKPTNPPNSNSLFCADAKTKTNIEELKGKKCQENLFRSLDSLNMDQKRPYREQEAKLQSSYEKEMEKYRTDLAEWERQRPDTKPLLEPFDVTTIKEPYEPKKCPSSYSIFCADVKTKPHIKEELKGKSRSERADILSKLWHCMDDDQKRPYRKQEAKLQSSYEKEMKKYRASLEEWKRRISNVQFRPHHGINQMGKEPTKPKKYPTSYSLFCADAKTEAHIREELSGKTLSERSQILSKLWESMNEEQKLPYKEQQSKLRSSYEKEMEKYRADLAEWKSQITCAQHLPHHGVNQVGKEPTKPKRFPTSYSLFCANAKTKPQIQNELRGKSLTERSQILSKHWESMNEEQKRPYQEQQSKLQLMYETEMKKYRTDLAEWKRRISYIQHFPQHGTSLMVKEPTKPKRFPTSYSLFCADAKTKPQIQNELKGKSLSDCVKILSRHWQSMNEEQKRPYKEKQAKSQSAYEEEMKKYKADLAEWKRQTPQAQPFPDHDLIQSHFTDSKLLSSVKASPKSKISTSVEIAREISLKVTKSKLPSKKRTSIESTSSSSRKRVKKAKLDCTKSTKEDSNLDSISAYTSRNEMQDCKQVPSQVQLAPIFLQTQKRKKSLAEDFKSTSKNPMKQFHQTTLDPEIKENSDNIEFEHLESVTTIDSALPTDTITFDCSQNSDHSTASANLEDEMKKMLEYCAPSSESSRQVKIKEKLACGDIVMVAKRTMPGINKLGGIARVTKVNQSGGVLKYDVSYVLGGREKEVDECFVSLHKDENEMKTDSHTSGRKRRSCRNGAVKDNVTMIVSDDANSATSMDSDVSSNKRRRIKS